MNDYGIVYRTTYTAGDAVSAANAIASIIGAASGGSWQIDGAITVASGEVALKAKSQTFAEAPASGNPNDQRIAVKGEAGGVLKIGYAPEGWDVGSSTFADCIATSAKSFTGMRSITGTATGFGATPTRVTVAQYRDDLTTAGPYPASTLTILLGTESVYSYGAHVGRGIAMDNRSDPEQGLHGDCLLVGEPVDIVTNFSWLRGDNAQGASNASVVRTGNTWWSYLQCTDNPTANMLRNVAGQTRIVPYCVFGAGKAIPGPADSTTNAGVLGQFKYIRECSISLAFGSQLRAAPQGASQAWEPMAYDAAARPQYVLWGPEVVI